ncbi:MAG: DUF2250 domain-containing protein, partial [Thermoplasmata archaeon]
MVLKLSQKIDITDDLVYRILDHFRRFKTDYAKSVGRDIELNKRVVCEILKKLYNEGYLEKRQSGMLKRKEAKLKRRVTTHPHHTYYQLTEKGKVYLEYLEKKLK